MVNFWRRLWLYWFTFTNLVAISVGSFVYALAYALLYFTSANIVGDAMHTLSFFSAKIGWAAGYIISFVVVLKRLFKREFAGFYLVMYDCKLEEQFEEIFISDTLKLWRKWLVRLAWAVIVAVLLIMLLHFMGVEALMKYVNIFTLWAFISFVGGYILVVTMSKCPRLKVIGSRM